MWILGIKGLNDWVLIKLKEAILLVAPDAKFFKFILRVIFCVFRLSILRNIGVMQNKRVSR